MQIFISYHHGDEDFAEVLRSKVSADGTLAAWTFRERLRAGDDWRHEIDQALRMSAALGSRDDARGGRVAVRDLRVELRDGARARPSSPVLLRPTKLHPKLSALQHVDFTRTSHRPWGALVRDVRAQAQRCYDNLRRLAEEAAEDLLALPPDLLGDVDVLQDLLNELIRDQATTLPTFRAIERLARRQPAPRGGRGVRAFRVLSLGLGVQGLPR